jgi:two-component system, chemotaxis family, protein-glutamate methylesterase/glutaminase
MSFSSGLSPHIRVLVADDSAVMRTALSRMLESSRHIQVCGTARNGQETIETIHLLQPDVVTLDVDMPVLDGLKALKRIMAECPCPVIMVSSLTVDDAEATLEALAAGAFDYVPKEDLQESAHPLRLGHSLIDKIEAAAQSPLARNNRLFQPGTRPFAAPTSFQERFRVVPKIIVLGTSTGGPRALQEILPELPSDLPVGMVVVQHMPPGFTGPLAKRLHGLSKLDVREASAGDCVEPGTVLIAPAGQHMTISPNSGSKGRICLSDTPSETLHKPSVDVTMLSAVEVFGRHTLGIILTGMGSDGLQGMTAIRNAGGITIGQDESSCVVYGMPRCCAELGILQQVVPLSDVPKQILQAVHYRPPA